VGEGASENAVEAIAAALAGDGSDRVIHLRTLYVGPEELLVAAKIGVEPTASGESIAEAINAAESRVREAVPEAKVIYIEPDIYQTSAAAPSEAMSPPTP
jgi:divalent metal cation (Fe/Co/Zn/Cd) transporter